MTESSGLSGARHLHDVVAERDDFRVRVPTQERRRDERRDVDAPDGARGADPVTRDRALHRARHVRADEHLSRDRRDVLGRDLDRVLQRLADRARHLRTRRPERREELVRERACATDRLGVPERSATNVDHRLVVEDAVTEQRVQVHAESASRSSSWRSPSSAPRERERREHLERHVGDCALALLERLEGAARAGGSFSASTSFPMR